ncbi:MAG: hypothetical protein NZ651_03260 [Candidatus Bipolaricaulota bacterium]|nr:hypothetical protein [Candidatus Bipolaricaulota bacterium]MDW8126772.1 hypothetical protein [Candidatus Bipolaricaulota bacterium]
MPLRAVFLDMNGTITHLPSNFTPARFLFSVYQKLGFEIELEKVAQAYEKTESWWIEHFSSLPPVDQGKPRGI